MGTQTQPVIHSALNAEIDSMVGAVDGGVGFDTKSTPHQTEIEKAQAELRQEYDAREERRKELEFLEKGGNPLDFQFAPPASLSVKLTPLLLEQNSSESNGNNGTTNGRNTTKRKNTASFEQSSRLDVSHNSKETDDSVVSDLDVKSPAYAQKKRSKLSHESSNLVATDLAQAYCANQPMLSSSETNAGDAKAQACEMHTVHTTISNPKTTGSPENYDSRIFASEDQLDMELDEVRPHKVPTGVISTPHLVGNGEDTMLNVNDQPSCETFKDSKHSEIMSKSILSDSEAFGKSDVNTENLQDKDQTTEEYGVHNGTRITNSNCGNCNIDGNAGGCQIFRGESDGVLIKEQKQTSESILIPDNTIIIENGNVRTADVHPTVHSEQCSALLNASISLVEVKSEECFENEETKQTQTAMASDSIHSTFELSNTCLSQRDPSTTLKIQDNTEIKWMKDHEDAILKEAHIIEDKLKRAQELPKSVLCSAKQLRPHWDYVLEEMAWLANDFMQERLWKIMAASQVCRRIALSGRENFENNNLRQKQRKVSQILAKEVIKFWNLAEENKDTLEGDPQRPLKSPIKCYATRFLQSGCSPTEVVSPEAPPTPDRISDAGTLEVEWEEKNSDERLYYKIPFGSMHTYRELETHCSQHEKIGKISNQMDCEASVGDSTTESNVHVTLEEDEDETSMCYMPQAFEGNRSLNFLHNNRKHLQQKAGASRSYGAFDLPYVPSVEGNFATQPLLVMGKRASGTSNASLKSTKRGRSTGRQQVTVKTDASSGDTNSIHDDQYSLQGGSHPRKNSDFESTVDFEKNQSKYMVYKNSSIANDCGGFIASGKGASYKQGWPIDSVSQLEQKKYLRKKTESHHFESNGTSGLYAQQLAKKPKTLKESPESSPKALVTGGAIPSSIASQITKISNSNKIMKVIPNRGKKTKAKAGASQSLSGSPWSLFEDQTLVVLVHDMGPNWELVSDIINSTVQFKCVFWKPQDCKERHKILMDKNSGDGVDGTEDSESSQPYPSTLHGIPNGCAGQLFQCLQAPMERDILKAHFEKIILIGKKRSCRIQRDNLDLKQPSPAHSSHFLALSQACPNNLTGDLLMPLDLCDTTTTPELLKYQGASNDGSTLPNYQGPVAPVLPASGSSTMHQGSPGMVVGNSFPSPSTATNALTRDGPRYGVPRPATLLADDQQKIQQYGQMVSGRSVPEPLPVGTDRGVRILNAGNGMGISRGMPMIRPGSQVIGSPRALNTVSSGSKLSSAGVGIPSPVSIRPGTGHGQGNSIMKPHDSLQMLRTGQNPEGHRQNQMVKQELQIQATQGNAQTVAPFNGIRTTFSNQTLSSSVQPFPMQQQPQMMHPQPRMLGRIHHPHIQGANHTRPQQQTYAINIAKQRQLQQRLAHQKQPFSGSNSMTPLQKGSHFPQQTQSSSSSMMVVSSSLAQQKQQTIPCNNPQTNISLPNQTTRQKSHQQIPQKQQVQTNNQHQHQQPAPAPVQTKSMKGNQIIDNKHMMQQNQATISGGSNLAPLQTSIQQKSYPRSQPQSSIQMSTVSSHLDSCNQGHVQIPPHSQALLASQQSHVPSSLPLTSHNQQPRQKNQPHQTMQRGMLHQSHHLCSDGHKGALVDSVQANQTIASPSTQCVGSVNPNPDVISAPAFSSQWKAEPSNEVNTRTPDSHISNASLTKLVGAESSMEASTLGSPQRQFSGSIPVHGCGTGEPRMQQQKALPQSKPPYPNQNQLHQQEEQRVAVNGQSSNSRQ